MDNLYNNTLYYLISIPPNSSCCRHYSMANYHYHDSRNVTVSKSFHIIFYYFPTRLINNPNFFINIFSLYINFQKWTESLSVIYLYLIPSSKNGFSDEPKYNALEHLQKIFYNFKYEVFCSIKRNFKISNLKFRRVKLYIWSFTTQNFKFHIFICILVPTITRHFYDS